MMLMMVAGVVCVVLLALQAAPGAETAGRTREFEEYQCRLTLPGEDYQWLDETKVPGCVTLFGDASGTVFVSMSVQRNQEGDPINEELVRGFDKGATQTGIVEKISGRIGRFRGVPCYQMHMRRKEDGSIWTARVFAANGYLFHLQVVGSPLPINERKKLAPLFAAFEFIGEPVFPSTEPTLAEEAAKSARKYKLIAIVSITILAVILLTIRDLLRRRKLRRLSETAAPQE